MIAFFHNRRSALSSGDSLGVLARVALFCSRVAVFCIAKHGRAASPSFASAKLGGGTDASSTPGGSKSVTSLAKRGGCLVCFMPAPARRVHKRSAMHQFQ